MAKKNNENLEDEFKYVEEEAHNGLTDTLNLYDPSDDVPGKVMEATDLFIEPQCSICNCKFRVEADQKYIDSIDPKTGKGSPAVIKNFLAKKGVEVFWTSCQIHGYNHIRTKYEDDVVITYGDKLLDMRHELKESEGQIDTAIAALFERLYKLGSYTDTNSLARDVEITKGIATVSDKLTKLWDLKNQTLQTAQEEATQQKIIAILTNILSKLPEEYHDIVREEIKKLKL
jgi:hypothetical protein